MNKRKTLQLQPDSYRNLLENSIQAIPFNIIIGGVFTIDLLFKSIPKYLILIWYAVITTLSLIRFFYTKYALKKQVYMQDRKGYLVGFLALTFLMGCTWGACYLLFLPYTAQVHEVVIILIFGGMAAGAATSLSSYLLAYYLFMMPMFLPVIVYNYSFFQLDRIMLATMCLLFVLMVITIARMNNRLLEKILQLNNQKDNLINELSVSNQKLEETNQEIRVMSITDSLTGLYNRRYFDNTLVQALGRSKRNQYALSLILIDVDNFKFINDTYGHPYGDDYLAFVSGVLKRSMRRATDVVFRLGGDEFAAILENSVIDDVNTLCETIRALFYEENKHENVTLSIGILCVEPENSDELKNIISAVDRMLYIAKEKGKNQTVGQVM
jgi:diguanylate cyclase (GGDEF)-like protein